MNNYDIINENNIFIGEFMSITSISVTNFTVFKSLDINFTKGINVFIGDNGTGKTHLLKLLISPCDFKTVLIKGNTFGNFFEDVFNGDKSSTQHLYNLRRDDKSSFNIVFQNETDTLNNVDGLFSIPVSFYNENSVFIPAKDMLTHSYNFDEIIDTRHVSFDSTVSKIIFKSKQDRNLDQPKWKVDVISKLEVLIGGRAFLYKDEFHISRLNGKMINFSLVAEGIKRLALLSILLFNNCIDTSSILIWDEPDAHINPKNIPILVDILLELQRNNIQIFISTHSYLLAKYFEVKQQATDSVLFHSLYNTEDGVKSESNKNFEDLKNNSITDTFNQLLDEIYDDYVGD